MSWGVRDDMSYRGCGWNEPCGSGVPLVRGCGGYFAAQGLRCGGGGSGVPWLRGCGWNKPWGSGLRKLGFTGGKSLGGPRCSELGHIVGYFT